MTHKEKYTKAIKIIGGIEKLRNYYPIKTRSETLNIIKDEYLNGISLVKFDRSFNDFMNEFYYPNKKALNELNINGSPASWVCILKQAMKIDFNLENLNSYDFTNEKYNKEVE